jgi:hypothetical protein
MRSILVLALACGCSGSSSNNNNNPDMAVALGMQRLIAGSYTLNAGQEAYICVRKTLTEDLLITEITPVDGMATHHQVLGIDTTATSADGSGACGGSGGEFDVFSWKLLFASGVNSPSLKIPDGAALKIAAGEQIVLQMHLLNASQATINSSAAIDIKTLPAGATAVDAEMVLAGPMPDSRLTPDIPPGDNQVVSGGCTLKGDTNYFAVFPHMHQIGKHIVVNARVGGVDQKLYDSDYAFNNQEFAQFAPVAMKKGDRINVTCTYNNDTGAPVEFGQSSLEEMCFAISFIYPPMPTGMFGDLCIN